MSLNEETNAVLQEVLAERERQDATWGPQDHAISTKDDQQRSDAFLPIVREICDKATSDGNVTWKHIIDEEYLEALAETDPVKRRMELVQLAAVVVAAIESEDRKVDAAKRPVHPTRPARPNCNLHDDCDSAENIAAARGIVPRYGPGSSRLQHCFDEGCEDCFGA